MDTTSTTMRPSRFVLLALGLWPSALLAQVDVTITADNAYSFGYGTAAAIGTLNGGVVNGSAGAIFNCVGGPETYLNIPAPANSYLYIVAWSDESGTQGVLGQFVPTTSTGVTVYTGTSAWQVFATGSDFDPPSTGPTLAQINAQIGLANTCTGGVGSSGGWVGVANNPVCTTGVLALGEANDLGGTFPQVCTTAIAAAARWMWYNPDPQGIANPFAGAVAGEYLIFRLPAAQVTNPKRVIINKDIQNTSGQTVAGVEILIAGQPSGILDIFHGTTPTFTVTTSGPDTLLTWSGGTIAPNAIFHVGFNMPQQSVEILGLWLIDSAGNRVGCAKQCNSNLHLYGFGGDITYKNSVTGCESVPLYCGQMALEWYENEVDLALLNGTSPRSPMRLDSLPNAPVQINPGSSVDVPFSLGAPPAGANFVVLSYVVGASPTLSGPVTRDWIEFTVDQCQGAYSLVYGTGCGPFPASLTAAPRPVLGTTCTLTTTSADPTVPFAITLLSVGSLPGIDLGIAGMPGCNLYIALPEILSVFAFGPSPFAVNLALPPDPFFAGLSVYAQSALFSVAAPPVNPANILVSNAIELHLDFD